VLTGSGVKQTVRAGEWGIRGCSGHV
jgi:hypothetical protein